jgi:hypothetical protein
VRRFERTADGTLQAQLDAEEAVLLQSLAGQVAEVIADDILRQAQEVSTSSTRPSEDSTSSTRPSEDSTSSTRPSEDSTSSTRPSEDSTSSTRHPRDTALARLLPDAYPGDAEASAEFRRFTQGGLAERKVGNAETLIRTLGGAGVTGNVVLNDSEALSWLRCLTDIRLTIAARLGIDTEDDDAGRSIDPLMREIYDWLGFVQNSLIEALDDQANRG